jgi:hypothetical protein
VTAPFWISAFLDLPATSYDGAVRFWSEVTGYAVSAPRGEHREFATLAPAEGDDYLRVQRVQDGPGGIHLDLHVADPRAAAAAATTLGATEVADRGYVVMRSPGGFTFCFVSQPADRRPPPRVHDDGTSSLVDQVCLDIPGAAYDEECAFWAALTGWEHQDLEAAPEFTRLVRPDGQPLHLLLQLLDETSGPVRAHLDLAADDRAAEVRRHVLLGARFDAEGRGWTVLRDPAGAAYCITGRRPATGRA